MLADRVRMGSVKSGNIILYSYGDNSNLWEVGLSSPSGGFVSKQPDHLLTEVISNEPSGFSATFSTVNKINLTNIDAITMLCEKSQGNRWTTLAVINDKSPYYTIRDTILNVVAPITPSTPYTNTVTLDVSSLVGEYYVTVGIMESAGFESHYAKIYEVVLE